MLLHDGDAHSFLNLFHAGQDEMLAAVLFLSIKADDQLLVENIMASVTQFDEALGKEIGFFLFGPQFNGTLLAYDEGFHVLAGRRLDRVPPPKTSGMMPIRELFVNADASTYGGDYAKDIRAKVARSTTKIVPQLCDALDIDRAALPVVCSIIRGSSDAIFVSCGSTLEIQKLIMASRRISDAVRDLSSRAFIAINGIDLANSILSDTAKLDTVVRRNKDRLLEFARELETQYAITIVPQLSALVRTKEISDVRLDELLSRLQIEKVEAIRADVRMKGIRSCITQLCKAHRKFEAVATAIDLQTLMRDEEFTSTIGDALQREIRTALSNLQIKNATISQRTSWLAPWLKRGLTFAENGEKVSHILHEGGYGQNIIDALHGLGKLS